MWSCWPARDWTSQISYEAVASVVRELSIIEALMCFITICTKYNAPLASVNGDSDDDRYDIAGCGAAGQPRLDLVLACSIKFHHIVSTFFNQLMGCFSSGAFYLVEVV